jgi:hypothetical protein
MNNHTNNQDKYQFGLSARLMYANRACVACQKSPGFTLKDRCESCASLQEVLDVAFAVLQCRASPVQRPGFYEVGYMGLDQLEASLVTLAKHLGLEQSLAFSTDRAHLPMRAP